MRGQRIRFPHVPLREMSMYLTVQMSIVLNDGVDGELLKDLIMNSGTNMPGEGFQIYHGDKVLGHIAEETLKVSVWPKESL